MTIAEAISIIKPSEHTMEAVKSAYRALAKQYHPDVNPHGLEFMKTINAAFDKLTEEFNSWTLRGFDYSEHPDILSDLQNMFDRIKHCIGLKAEVCGTWLWITGNTRAYRDIFKELGMKWSNNKKAWYWHPGDYVRRHRKTFSLDEIRYKYGSTNMDFETLSSIA